MQQFKLKYALFLLKNRKNRRALGVKFKLYGLEQLGATRPPLVSGTGYSAPRTPVPTLAHPQINFWLCTYSVS